MPNSQIENLNSGYNKSEIRKQMLQSFIRRNMKKSVSLFAALAIFTAFSLFTIRIAHNTSSEKQSLVGKAAENTDEVKSFLSPDNVSGAKGLQFRIHSQIIPPIGKKIGFLYLSFKFNPQYLKYISIEPANTTTGYKLLKSSPPDESNKTGQLDFMVGIEKPDTTSIPSVNMPEMVFEILNDSKNSIVFNTPKMQAILLDSKKTGITPQNESVINATLPTNVPTVINIVRPTITIPAPSISQIPITLTPVTPTKITTSDSSDSAVINKQLIEPTAIPTPTKI
jgi:hypothetical protein